MYFCAVTACWQARSPWTSFPTLRALFKALKKAQTLAISVRGASRSSWLFSALADRINYVEREILFGFIVPKKPCHFANLVRVHPHSHLIQYRTEWENKINLGAWGGLGRGKLSVAMLDMGKDGKAKESLTNCTIFWRGVKWWFLRGWGTK